MTYSICFFETCTYAAKRRNIIDPNLFISGTGILGLCGEKINAQAGDAEKSKSGGIIPL